MTEVPDPPPVATCHGCHEPLVWLWSPRRGWLSLVTVAADTLRLHRCRDYGRAPTWRDRLPRQHPDTVHLGAAKARAALAMTRTRESEEQDHDR